MTRRPRVAVVGGGPGGLMAAEVLARHGAEVTVFERMPSPGRKLLLAGRGGLNLTHSEPLDRLLERYGAARPHLEAAIRRFPPSALREWSARLGQPTFVGSSGRVFPEAFRATPLLRSWLAELGRLGVTFRLRHTWTGWDDEGALTFTDPAGDPIAVTTDAAVLALGGATWPRTGSDGGWVGPFAAAGIAVRPLRPANCGFDVAWTARFAERFAGVPLKNIGLSVGGGGWSRGEAMITSYGIEGGGVYAQSAALRDAVERDGSAVLSVDLHPDLTVESLATRLARRRPADSTTTFIRRAAGLAPVAVGVLREDSRGLDRSVTEEPERLARRIKDVHLRLISMRPLARAISTAGGVGFDQVGPDGRLRSRPDVFLVGEMLDWEAPTGGYLLQATFSTAVAAAEGALRSVGLDEPNGAPERGNTAT